VSLRDHLDDVLDEGYERALIIAEGANAELEVAHNGLSPSQVIGLLHYTLMGYQRQFNMNVELQNQ
jgi:hypothetical protein